MKELIDQQIDINIARQIEEADVQLFETIREKDERSRFAFALRVNEKFVSIQVETDEGVTVSEPEWCAIPGKPPFGSTSSGKINVYVKGHGLYRSYCYTVMSLKISANTTFYSFRVEKDDISSKKRHVTLLKRGGVYFVKN